ncbi:MAG TPA: hypothetical protein VJJ82_05875 [Candidatus Nanoarchaeia archaeon]|nr:hypothetical protein [Candidatus Nanoarchaeia archaeon]
MYREDVEDWMGLALKVLGVVLLLVLIGGSIYMFIRVDATLKNVETNVDTQIKEAISKFSVPVISTQRKTTAETIVNSQPDNVSTIVAKAQSAFAVNDVVEGRKQLVLLEQSLAKTSGTETARQLNRDLIAAVDKEDIASARTISDKLLAELDRIGQG